MRPLVRSLTLPFRAALDYALPPRCPGCGTITGDPHRFCLDCWRRLDFLSGPACSGCGEPFERVEEAGGRCAGCLADPPALDRVEAAVAYGEIARTLAIRLKHGRRPGLAETMGRLLAQRVEHDARMVLVPVPLHRWRLWSRGFNQSLLIARVLARETRAELAPALIERRRATPMLRGMSRSGRARAVAGAFRVAPAQAARIKGRTVVLVDDVHTTGATANACARVLKRAGAAEVRLACWARVAQGGGDGVDRQSF